MYDPEHLPIFLNEIMEYDILSEEPVWFRRKKLIKFIYTQNSLSISLDNNKYQVCVSCTSLFRIQSKFRHLLKHACIFFNERIEYDILR